MNFGEYRFRRLKFSYRPRLNQNGSTTTDVASGTVIMAAQYNPDRPNFDTKAEIMDHYGSKSSSTFDSAHMNIDTNPDNLAGPAGKYVRALGTNNGSDTVRYDVGRLTVAVSLTPAAWVNSSLGELFVEYEVELSKPRHFAGIGRSIRQDFFSCYPLTGKGTVVGNLNPWEINWTGNHKVEQSANSNLGCFLNTSFVGGIGQKIRVDIPLTFTGYIELAVTFYVSAVDGQYQLGGIASNHSTNIDLLESQFADQGTVNQSQLVTWPQGLVVGNSGVDRNPTMIKRFRVRNADNAESHIAYSATSFAGNADTYGMTVRS